MPLSTEALVMSLAGFMSGYYFSGAFVFMPAVLRAPPPLVAQQWKRAWDVGRIVGKVIVTSSAAGFAYLAYTEKDNIGSLRFQLLTAAAGIVGSIVPFTVITSYPFNEAINSQLFNSNGASKKSDDAPATDLKALVAQWGQTDFKRSLLAFLGTAVGLAGVLA
ncbi:unnamed protein product [Clonostachys byssicola]|uniref:DUF1772-domain-containing protein n=1 Tax=Clonostachys byssicola TaxID=160290 RepID=A0A9N9UMY1_9HYPO|nr:unnamed protein product [Clonostachys byssicola]